MARWERYEIWIPDGSDWVLHSWWRDIDFASAVFHARSGAVRLVRARCDDEQVIGRSMVVESERNPSVSPQWRNPATSRSPEPVARVSPLVREAIARRFVAGHHVESRILLYGCALYLASNIVGQGLGVPAEPRAGLMAAAAGLLICVLSIARCSSSKQMCSIVAAFRAALLVGFASSVVALAAAAVRPFYDLNNVKWGAIPPPWLLFSAIYGISSLIATEGVKWFQSRERALA